MVYFMGAALVFFVFLIFKHSGSFFKSLVTSTVGGVGALCAVNALSYFIPLSIGLNWYTVCFSALFSVPGVIFMLVSEAVLF